MQNEILMRLLDHLGPDDPYNKLVQRALEGEELHPFEAKQITAMCARLAGKPMTPEDLGLQVAPMPPQIKEQLAAMERELERNPGNKVARDSRDDTPDIFVSPPTPSESLYVAHILYVTGRA
ncbi:hypothetical protein EI42_03266 [Thermosporothrix hazakensis]|jgi:hypothetical protein|uniref:Uncharacterized protein n=1 Tax=Thermosporothrix hazakensis TaxID=644383 RepID=A0A326U5F8_THEHA|nr:hypothetical protein [Thermosporothrix hazakensis]PZW28512.1 hypothetical protein EI42_03266 [Thermosporothrix hazakensis]GCE45286.1 hypothetical protein KTH_01550 [Thermosporothrix hazakensis]